MHDLGYQDGQLNNLVMIEGAERIQKLVQELTKDRTDIEIEFMSSDLNGISGHIDHIVAARAAILAFYRLKETDRRLKRIRLSCIPESYLPTYNTAWLYMEPGRCKEDINETIDAREHLDEIIAIMRAHHSQRGDGETHIEQRRDKLGLNYFIVKE